MKENFLYRGPSGKGPRIVAIGGGTGLSTMLRGLKRHTNNLTAIVTVADDGGGSGGPVHHAPGPEAAHQ